jgi:tetratricopeptide (TPR) repeat protein
MNIKKNTFAIVIILLIALTGCQSQYMRSGNIYLQHKQPTKALHEFQMELKTNPNNVEAIKKIADIHFNNEEYLQSFNMYEKALNISKKTNVHNKKFIDEIKKFKEASWVRIYKKATTAFKNDDFDTALKDIKPLENLGLKLDKVYQLESIIYLKKKNDDKAIIYLEKTFEVNNKNKAIANQLAVLYFKKDNFEKAAEYYQKVINLDPNNVDTYFNLAITYGKLENNDKVISTYEKILSIDPKNTDALNYLGYQYFSAKNYNKAIEFFTKYCKINNTDADALRLLTFSYAKNKNFRQAVNTAIEWHKVDPTDTVAVQMIVANANMGKMHKIAKKYSKILKTME